MKDVPTGGMLRTLRTVIDAIEDYNEKIKVLRKAKDECETEIKRRALDEGVTKFASDDLSVTIYDKWVSKYDPEKWSDLIAWASKTGNTHLVQRKLSDKKVRELADSGVELPEFLTLQAFPQVWATRPRS